jgi:Glycosyl transferase family 90
MKRAIAFLLLCIDSLIGLDRMDFSESPPQWMVDQIQKDLEPFTIELSRTALNAIFCAQRENACLTRVRIINGKIQCEYGDASQAHPAPRLIIDSLQQLNAVARLPDMDFVFTGHDCLFSNPFHWPIFAETKKEHAAGILFPDRWALQGYTPDKNEIFKGNAMHPWEQKIPLLFFRGSSTCRTAWEEFYKYSGRFTGPPSSLPCNPWDCFFTKDRDTCPRILLARLSVQLPDWIDAKLLYGKNLQDISEGLTTEIGISLSEHPHYKYLMDIDGSCASFPRSAALFHSNSVVFKEVSPSKQWWHVLLVPYVHYIPVYSDLSNVVSQIEWAKNHDEECKEISENARQLVYDALSEKRIYQYLYQLLLAYAAKQQIYYDRDLWNHVE